MSRARILRRRLRTLATLHEAVGALRALSAQHFRLSRALLPSVRAYRDEVERALGVLPATPVPAGVFAPGPAAIVLVSADVGLCGDYATRLAEEALAARAELGPGPLLCLGRRAVPALARGGVQPDRVDPAPASVAALPHLLLPLVDELLALRAAGRMGRLVLVSARFEGAGHFRPIRVPVLPVAPPPGAPRLAASPYGGLARLRAVVVREHLYVALYEALLGALASEHGKRLVTAESARRWLEERTEAAQRQLAANVRESSTQEVLETVSAARAAQRNRAAQGAEA